MVASVYLVPQWFFWFGIFLEIIFAIVAAFVSSYAYKIYSLTYQKRSLLLSQGFAFISIAYIIKALLNAFVLSEVRDGFISFSIDKLNLVGLVGAYAHILLFITGLVTLAYMTFNVESRRAYSLILITNFVVLVMSADKGRSFNLLSSILILYICFHCGLEYINNKNGKTLLFFLAFIFLLFSGAGFLIAGNYYLIYVIGHALELAAYILILSGLILILTNGRKNGQKKNKA